MIMTIADATRARPIGRCPSRPAVIVSPDQVVDHTQGREAVAIGTAPFRWAAGPAPATSASAVIRRLPWPGAPHRVDPEPVPERVASGAAADPGLRAVHRRRDHRRDRADQPPPDGPRRQFRRRLGCGQVGGAVRHSGRSHLPRHHRPGAVLRPRSGPVQRPAHLGRRARHPRRHPAGARSGPTSARAPARGIRLDSFGDAAVPGVVLAQAIGRLGNWFNNELYGRATTLPWKLQIHCLDVEQGKANICTGTNSTVLGYFQPTFLYELPVGRGPGRIPDLGRAPVRPRPRPGVRPLRDGLRGRPVLGRGAALGPRQPHPGPAGEHGDDDGRLRLRVGSGS